jgi:apolipoprotein N-acyltransferase
LTAAVVAGEGIKIVIGWGSLIAVVALGLIVALRARRHRDAAGHAKTPAPEGTGVTG